MIEWVRRIIFNGCWKLAEKLKTDNDERHIRNELLENNKKEFINAPDVLNGESPWKLHNNIRGGVSVYVYCYDSGNWENITDCSNRILGVKTSEIIRVMLEKFKGVKLKDAFGCECCFENDKDAQIFIDDVSPWYDEYHLPHAMMDRMLCYAEGGYPPYFKDDSKCPSKEKVEEQKVHIDKPKLLSRQIRAIT